MLATQNRHSQDSQLEGDALNVSAVFLAKAYQVGHMRDPGRDHSLYGNVCLSASRSDVTKLYRCSSGRLWRFMISVKSSQFWDA